MKLCKDCKHSVWPSNPYSNYVPGIAHYTMPMCGHPTARRSVVNGDLLTSCMTARGACDLRGATDESVCWPNAKLFEERPPAPKPIEMEPGDPVCVDAVYGKPGILQRLLTFRWGR